MSCTPTPDSYQGFCWPQQALSSRGKEGFNAVWHTVELNSILLQDGVTLAGLGLLLPRESALSKSEDSRVYLASL